MTVGWWPPDVPFDVDDMATVFKLLKDQHDAAARRRR